VAYASSLPASADQIGCDVNSLVEDLIDKVNAHVTSNSVVIPILQTFNVLLEGDALSQLSDDSRGIRRPVFPQIRLMHHPIFFTVQFTTITFDLNKECWSAEKHSKDP
jgi:Tubulin folding cofactor D C terminal